MARTASPLTAIKRMRAELDRLEGLISRTASKGVRSIRAKVASRRSTRRTQVCSKCGEPGHNARGHRAAQRRR